MRELLGWAGLDFESSFRMYLESFRLPGEAQKIARVLEAFGQEYHKQCPDIFYNSDVVYVLSYSVIMLNTDQHNSQVSAALKSWASLCWSLHWAACRVAARLEVPAADVGNNRRPGSTHSKLASLQLRL